MRDILLSVFFGMLSLAFVFATRTARRLERKQFKDEGERKLAESGKCQSSWIMLYFVVIFGCTSIVLFTRS